MGAAGPCEHRLRRTRSADRSPDATSIVTVAGADVSAPSLTVKVNVSVPLKLSAGV